MIVYKDGGNCHREGGMFSWKGVKDDDELAELLADGWYKTLAEAIAPKEEKTRAELEAIATELGIKFDGRSSDKTLQSKIEEALK